MDLSQKIVQEFQETFGHPVATKPVAMGVDRALARSIWTAEELVEFLAASVKNKEEFAKLYYEFEEGVQKAYKKSLDAGKFPQTEGEMIVAQSDALGDTNIFVNGTAIEMGINLFEVTNIIHLSNMSKMFTDENGNKYVKYDETNGNKVMKSPEFFAPEANLAAYMDRRKISNLFCASGDRRAFLIENDQIVKEVKFEDLKAGNQFILEQDGLLVERNGVKIFKAKSDAYRNEEYNDWMIDTEGEVA